MARKHSEIEELEELEEQLVEEKDRIVGTTRKAMLAYVGAFGMAQDEAANLFNRCIKRGEIAEKDARKMLKSINQRSKPASRNITRARQRFNRQIERVLNSVSIPSKRDVDLLNNKMTMLNEKIDRLTGEAEKLPSKRDVTKLAAKVEELKAETEDLPSKRDVTKLAAKVENLKDEIPQRKK